MKDGIDYCLRYSVPFLLERRAESNNRKTDHTAENIRNYIVIRIGIYYNFFIIELRREADENI